VVLCLVFDQTGQILLIKQPWANGWLVPGGAKKADESLRATAIREIEEETGVIIRPTRPHWIHDHTVKNAET
ncbi:MAG: NUDIX hydrolase, partial [Halobacteriaceae archaeon]